MVPFLPLPESSPWQQPDGTGERLAQFLVLPRRAGAEKELCATCTAFISERRQANRETDLL